MSASILATLRSALGESQQARDNAKADFHTASDLYQAAEEEFHKLKAAVAALNGETAPAPDDVLASDEILLVDAPAAKEPEETPEGFVKGPEGELIDVSDIDPPKSDTRPPVNPANPLDAVKCPGCGKYGGIRQVLMNRGGRQVLTHQCTKCGSEIM